MATETITANDAVRLVHALNDACNADDIARALACFAADALVQTLPPPPSGRALWRGTEQVRAFLQWQADEHFHVTSHNIQVRGTTVTWDSAVSLASFRQLGLDPVAVAVEAVVRAGKISSFTGTLSPETQRQIQAATQQGSAAPAEAAT